MTREEAIELLKKSNPNNIIGISSVEHRDIFNKRQEAFDMAIKALEQEPCEDCISRQAVLDLIADYCLSMGQVVKGIHALPSVTPQLKTDVLDKIRAEIESDWQLKKYPSSPFSCGLRRAIEIIDKYKGRK